jgi:LacI family transcriptional regulator
VLSSVSTDDAALARQAVGYLLERGHRAIGMIGVAFDPAASYVACRFSLESTYQATRRLIDSASATVPLTAIFAMADIQAVGAIRALADSGLELSQFVSPRLATLRQSVERLDARSVETLLGHLAGGEEPVHELISFELIEGQSVRSL